MNEDYTSQEEFIMEYIFNSLKVGDSVVALVDKFDGDVRCITSQSVYTIENKNNGTGGILINSDIPDKSVVLSLYELGMVLN